MEFWNFNGSVSMKGFAGILKIPERDRKDHLFLPSPGWIIPLFRDTGLILKAQHYSSDILSYIPQIQPVSICLDCERMKRGEW